MVQVQILKGYPDHVIRQARQSGAGAYGGGPGPATANPYGGPATSNPNGGPAAGTPNPYGGGSGPAGTTPGGGNPYGSGIGGTTVGAGYGLGEGGSTAGGGYNSGLGGTTGSGNPYGNEVPVVGGQQTIQPQQPQCWLHNFVSEKTLYLTVFSFRWLHVSSWTTGSSRCGRTSRYDSINDALRVKCIYNNHLISGKDGLDGKSGEDGPAGKNGEVPPKPPANLCEKRECPPGPPGNH